AQGTGPAFRHGIANLDEQICHRAFVPMRKKRLPLDGRSPLGSNQREVVASRAGLIEFGLSSSGLLSGEDTVPDFGLRVSRKERIRHKKAQKTQIKAFVTFVPFCGHSLVVVIWHSPSIAGSVRQYWDSHGHHDRRRCRLRYREAWVLPPGKCRQ